MDWEDWVTRLFAAYLMLGIVSLGCSRHQTSGFSSDLKLAQVQQSIADGNYNAAVSETKEIASQASFSASTPEALYLEAYCMVYGWGDFHQATRALKQLLQVDPKGELALPAQKLLADCDYWQGNYSRAIREYGPLATTEEKGLEADASLQIANCLLLKNKVGDAITAYRAIVDKAPAGASSDMAQMMIANIYLKIQNPTQAKTEFQKLLSFTRNKKFQEDAQNCVRQIDAQEPFQKSDGNRE
jgi:tetratricopeptide (TPR) repeat protein